MMLIHLQLNVHSSELHMIMIDLHLTNTTSATTSPTRAHWQRRPRSSPPLIARARPTWMVSAKANASEDVVPEFVGDLIPFDKARVTTSVSPWTARGGGWLCVEWGGGRRRTLKGHNAGASRQASTHGFVNWLGCVLGCQGWMRTTATR
ncbi:uncharacterized protein LOC125538523 isoform X2 [Triticum urartu]|uniref:uncharacterized protein LOC125538523 isoform X2 n=1 Tax=Triticum urartu TaxID=4572 RepID=UPI0020433DAD|nr:uncharacterized protein LOC125538523 isoform X2 [Triticum urartu]